MKVNDFYVIWHTEMMTFHDKLWMKILVHPGNIHDFGGRFLFTFEDGGNIRNTLLVEVVLDKI